MDSMQIMLAGIPLDVEFFLNAHGRASIFRATPHGLPREYDLLPYLNEETVADICQQVEAAN